MVSSLLVQSDLGIPFLEPSSSSSFPRRGILTYVRGSIFTYVCLKRYFSIVREYTREHERERESERGKNGVWMIQGRWTALYSVERYAYVSLMTSVCLPIIHIRTYV